jgi:hypothetical protein
MIDDREHRDGHQYPELDSPVILTVYTRSPQKWLLLDRETGQTYEGNFKGTWDKLVNKEPQQ